MFEIKEDENLVERALIIALRKDGLTDQDLDNHLDELEQLLENLSIPVVGRVKVPFRKPQPRYLIGKGKAEEIADMCKELKADCLIFDDEISPAQQRNWEKLLNITVLERHEIILDIFSQRAQTKEAKLQIALARAKYNLPRLTNAWTHLSRQRGGGKGQRGEGEQQIELDKRMTRLRISKLEKELKAVQLNRKNQRKQREQNSIPVGAIVGYTNAGKSSLLNTLSNAGVLAQDKLFATLDPTTKKINLLNNKKVLLTDTVGFIRKLPHQLIESFKSTLEEAHLADFLVHVIDVTTPHLDDYYNTTMEVLKEIGANDKPMIVVFNKVDMLNDQNYQILLEQKYSNTVFVSTKTKYGIKNLLDTLSTIAYPNLEKYKILVPHNRYDVVLKLKQKNAIDLENYIEEGVELLVELSKKDITEFKEFLI